MKNKIKIILFIFCILLQEKAFAWGWQTHRYINEKAVDYLPPEMDFFQDYQSYISSHATDPDSDNLPGYYHYIDIDYYDDFFAGTFPHNWDDAVAQYGYSVLIDYGTVPWVIEEWTDSLSSLMSSGQWDDVWQIAAELGHYVADSHQPLHLTLNYNGQSSGNYGIHSRYETQMMNSHLADIPIMDSSSVYWNSVIDSTFRYIGDIYPYVSDILDADDLASDQDPNQNSTYYNILWEELDSMTIEVVHSAIIDLASIWHTAWVNAGTPTLSIQQEKSIPSSITIHPNFPNPFNPSTTLHYDLSEPTPITLAIHDITGHRVKTLFEGEQTSGYKSIQWNAANDDGVNLPAGIYFYTIRSGNISISQKLIYMK
jgi:hypothetical protein